MEANSDPDITNNMVSHTFSTIYLGPTGNIQGTKKVFNLKTGAVKKVRTVKSYPLSDHTIDLVNAWGHRYQKEEKKLEFLNCQRLKYDWDNDELEYTEGIVYDSLNVDFLTQFPII